MDTELEKDCEELKQGLKIKGDLLINFILSKTNKERQQIREAYKVCCGTDLLEDIEKNLSDNFQRTVRALFQRPAEYDAESLYYGMKGLGTDEDVLIEILCTRSNEQLKKIIEEFDKISPKYTLEQWIMSETSGSFRNLLTSLIQCKRSENSIPDESRCYNLALELYKAGEDKIGTNEEIFNKIFTESSPPEIFNINDHYSIISRCTLREAIESEYSGDAEKTLLTILDYILNQSEYYARRVNYAIKGLGTKDRMLIRALVSREEIDIHDIKESYKKLFGNNMEDDIKRDTSGDYSKILVGIVNSICR